MRFGVSKVGLRTEYIGIWEDSGDLQVQRLKKEEEQNGLSASFCIIKVRLEIGNWP